MRLKMDLIVETEPVTPTVMAALCAARGLRELICDRCQDPDEVVVTTMQIQPLEEAFTLCGNCARELPRGYHMA
jgi:hypothetical protein